MQPQANTRGRSEASGVYLVIPAFNEGSALGEVIAGVVGRFPSVVVVDDGSVDGTAGVALAAGATVLVHPVNLGQGAALQTGLRYALRMGARYIVTFDADGQHDADDIPRMIEALERSGADVALGSRFLAGSTTNATRARRLLLKAATVFTRLTTGLRVTDAHNGMRVLTAAGAERLRIRQNRMAHASEILEQIASERIAYVECPVNIRYTDYSRAKGQSGFEAVNILIDLLMQRIKS
jgi:glycosyltransferase involved in cell wall biosynthesis